MEVLEVLHSAHELLRPCAEHFEPSLFSSSDAVDGYEAAVVLRRYCDVLVGGSARRVEEANAWQASGAASAAQFLANRSGDDPRAVAGTLITERRLEDLPQARDAYRCGHLSSTQVSVVARAGEKAPELVGSLLELAQSSTTIGQLRRTLHEVTAGQDTAGQQRGNHERSRAQRHASWRVDEARQRFELYAAGPLADFGLLFPELQATTDDQWRKACQEKRKDGFPAYRYDAVVELFTRSTPKKRSARHKTMVVIDDAALQRGYLEPGEQSKVIGVGTIPVVAMAELLAKPNVRRVTPGQVEQANELVASINDARRVSVATTLEVIARDGGLCAVPFCDDHGDHLDHRRPASERGSLTVNNLALLCASHHRMKSTQGWCIVGAYGSGGGRWVKRRPGGDGGSGYPLDHDEDPNHYSGEEREACPRTG